MGAFQLNNLICPMDWFQQKNAQIRSGSRVFVSLQRNTTPETSPVCFSTTMKKTKQQHYAPIKDFDTCVAQNDQHGLYYRYDVRRLSDANTYKKPQMNARFKLNNLDDGFVLCMDMLRPSEISNILAIGDFYSKDLSELKTFLMAAQSAAHKEHNANKLALSFMYSVYETIQNKTSEALQSVDVLTKVLNDYRCSINGKELTADIMRYLDVQQVLTKLVKLRCCRGEQHALAERVKAWVLGNQFHQVSKVGVTASGQTSIYYFENDVEYRAVFSTNVHGKSTIGKPRPVENLLSVDSYSFFIA